jgi:hypothetical protein
MAMNVVANKNAYLTIEVANAIMNYNAFVGANGGAYSYEGALRSAKMVKEVGQNATIGSHTSDRTGGAFARFN